VVNYVEGEDAANAVVEEIKKSGANAYAHQADVASEDEVNAMFARMIRNSAPSTFSSPMPACSATRRFTK